MGDTALNVRLGAKTAEFNKKIAGAGAKLQKFGAQVGKVGKSMTMMVTAPLLAAGAASVKLSLDFQKSMTKIQTLVGRTTGEIAHMKKEVLKLSSESAQSPKDLADALYFLESGGLKAENAIETLETVAKGAAIGLGEMESIATVGAAAQNAYGIETITASDAIDKFAVMVRTGMFDAEQLSSVLGKQLGTAAELGISFDEAGAYISTFTSVTGDATGATTSFGAIMDVFTKLDVKPTENQAVALDKIGLSAGQVKEMLSEKGLMGTMKHLKGEFDKNGVSMGAFMTSSVALKGSLTVLGNQAGAYSDNLEQMQTSTENAGAVQEGFAVTSETDAFKMEQSMNSITVAGVGLGDALVPVVQKITEKINELTTWWNGLDKSSQDNIASWIVWIATVGPVLMIVGKMITLGGSAIKMFKTWNAAVKVAGGIQMWFNGVMAANPISIIILAFTALVAAIWYFATSNSKVAIDVRNVFGAMANVVIGAINSLIKGINKFSSKFGYSIPTIKKFGKEAYPAVKVVKEEVKDTTKEVENLNKSFANIKPPPPIDIEVEGGDDTGGGGDGNEEQAAIDAQAVKDAEDLAKKKEDAEAKSLENIAKLKQQFAVLNATTDQEAARISLDNQEANALGKVTAEENGAEERMLIEDNFAKKRSKLLAKQDKENKKIADNTATAWEESLAKVEAGWNKVSDVAGQVFGAVDAMMSAQAEKEAVELENKHVVEDEEFALWQEQQDIKAEEIATRLAAGLITEEEAEKQKEALELESAAKEKALMLAQDKETAAIEKKAAKREKKMAIMSAIMNGATAVVKALGSAPPPLNFVLAAVVGALAAVQIAAVASTPIPMAEGGIAFGPTNALVGEYSGAKSNPEVVAPLDKLKTMLGDKNSSKPQEIFGTLKGNDIFLSNDLTATNRLRYT
tara:strand:- start:11579 stop:14320 length:2742 start_codon:yes stop_codon:yes gene_type:complete